MEWASGEPSSYQAWGRLPLPFFLMGVSGSENLFSPGLGVFSSLSPLLWGGLGKFLLELRTLQSWGTFYSRDLLS